MQSAKTLQKTAPIPKNTHATPSLKTEMPVKNTYLQNCPICGRPLKIRAEYRGRKLNCRHCGGKFTAIDPASPLFAAQNASNALLRRADRLLELCARKFTCG